jgi:hypothetical protein
MFVEKRTYKRFKGKEGAFAVFIRPNELINTGQIQDISMGGLCVRYLSMKGDKEGCSEIEIFAANGRFIHMNKFQFRIAYDRKVPEYSWGRYGVEFKNLSVEHLSILQDFIDHFAFDETQKSKRADYLTRVKPRKSVAPRSSSGRRGRVIFHSQEILHEYISMGVNQPPRK